MLNFNLLAFIKPSAKLKVSASISATNHTQIVVQYLAKPKKSEEKLILNSHQIEMLMMSENDIEQANLISETDLEKEDAEWMD